MERNPASTARRGWVAGGGPRGLGERVGKAMRTSWRSETGVPDAPQEGSLPGEVV